MMEKIVIVINIIIGTSCSFCFVTGIVAIFQRDDIWIVLAKSGIRHPCEIRISEGETGNNQAFFACLR